MLSWGWRGLGWFWAGFLGLMVLAVAILGLLGPPKQRRAAQVTPQNGAVSHPSPPLRALLEPAPDFPGALLPRIGADGLAPRQAYAAMPITSPLPKIGLLVAGIGLNQAQSQAALAALPAAVDFAMSAYATATESWAAALRGGRHEFFQSLPMEPQSYPIQDEGDRQLLTGGTAASNQINLEWALSRSTGYAGVTGFSDGQTGEGFAALPVLMRPVLDQVAARGLLYLDPRPSAQGSAGGNVIVVIDPPTDDPAAIAAKLDALAQAARHDGHAIGLVGRADPVTLGLLKAWIARLPAEGVALTPISALLPDATP